jgi:hypothetical protein
MAKSKKKIVPPPGIKGLAILAGLPATTSTAITRTLAKDFAGWEFISTPFPEEVERRYTSPGPINKLLYEATSFALETLGDSKGERIPRPSQIVLLYASGPRSATLVEQFGFAARYVEVLEPEDPWKHGRHWTHRMEDALLAFKDSMNFVESEKHRDIKLRIEKMKSHDPLLLPARNFNTQSGTKLADLFLKFALEEGKLELIDQSIKKKRYKTDELPLFYPRMGGKNMWFCYDARGFVFARTANGQHGPARMISGENSNDTAARRRLLEALFRFGTPLADGFQHDVQLEGGRLLKSAVFECAEAGEISVSADHANVYSNDVVRAP